jgi:hypothetical protein
MWIEASRGNADILELSDSIAPYTPVQIVD